MKPHKLKEILQLPAGTVIIWLYERESDALARKRPVDALRRAHAYTKMVGSKAEGVQISTRAMTLIDNTDSKSEGAVEITIISQPNRTA